MRYMSIVAAVVTLLLTFPQEVVPKRPEADAKPEDDFKATEDSGTASHVLCNVTGPCVPCSTAEKEEDWSVCKATGYRQPITCLLRSDWTRDKDQDQNQQQDQQQEKQATEEVALVKAMPLRKSSRKSRGARKLFEAEEGAVKDSARLAALAPGETRLSALLKLPGAWRRHLSYEAANPPIIKSERRFDTFQSCSLESAKGSNESISVLVFEGVMALLLAGAIPVVVMRRKLSFVRKN